MDALTDQTSLQQIARDKGAMPQPAPLAMPVAPLRAWRKQDQRPLAAPDRWRTPWFSRVITFGGMAAISGFGGYQMYKVVEAGGVTLLEWLFMILFVVNFSWIALAFTSGIVGMGNLLRHGITRKPVLPDRLTARTAVVMPIYNESPGRVFGTVQAIAEDVIKTGHAASFDFFFLSDTTDPDIWIAEERAFVALRERLSEIGIHYRHRQKNTARKAGNIADFVTTWGGNYAHMLVLDADSVMTGETIVALADAMEKDPDAGIIQTLPRLINRNTLIARLQQFAAGVYGPLCAAGLAVWSGRDGNYWGHNAIIRMEAFAGSAGLPDLRGRPPFGGHILSHDFVEAGLIRRRGYAVYMLPQLGGSYEESPPSLMDLAIRDRRWCQGNLQHSRVILSKGLHWATRQHLATGIMSYMSSPLWLIQLLVGLLLALQAAFIRPEYFTNQFTLFPAWPVFDAERAFNLFIFTMVILLAPKVFGWFVTLLNGPARRGSGGAIRLTISAVLEIILSGLLAPVMMLVQAGSVFSILSGRDTGWKTQRRDDGSIPLRSIIARHWRHTLLGVVAAIAAFSISPYIFAWMSPTIIGLWLAVPTSWASASASLGWGLRRLGLLLIPEETKPPELAERAHRLGLEFDALGLEDRKALDLVHGDDRFRELHQQIIQVPPPRVRGRIDTDRVIAEAKLTDAQSLDDARQWLSGRETVLVLHDRALIALLAALPESGSKAA
ncbi:glucans biosynthesis glucosyltransferase MdoH [Phreatobacter stygius]|uniref:Glucans biosynthesis glucosyltransferase H n=2 Tax=Phreatobacter stygius TaxID=1940610 RepID=A0A4D7BEM4_9HYPH|nr:glucans biosynthesis glucosyltransferase MdoH [Phreatobacter stygius]